MSEFLLSTRWLKNENTSIFHVVQRFQKKNSIVEHHMHIKSHAIFSQRHILGSKSGVPHILCKLSSLLFSRSSSLTFHSKCSCLFEIMGKIVWNCPNTLCKRRAKQEIQRFYGRKRFKNINYFNFIIFNFELHHIVLYSVQKHRHIEII